MFSPVVKKVFSREREKTQAVKNRFGSQSYFFEVTKIDQFQNKPANREYFHLMFVVAVANMPRK